MSSNDGGCDDVMHTLANKPSLRPAYLLLGTRFAKC